MSDIAEMLREARERLANITDVLSQITRTSVEINENYAWDGGDSLVDFKAEGADTPELASNMSGLSQLLIDDPNLLKPPFEITPEVNAYLDGLADARGDSLSREQAEADYLRFLGLAYAADPPLNLTGELGPLSQNTFGTEGQLRYGHVVGEVLEIDPVFASLMNPNGGFTGPGPVSVNIDGNGLFEEAASTVSGIDNEALAYHSATHDGFGFLEEHYDTGAGYRYAGESGYLERTLIDENSPLGGQVTGIEYWENKLGNDPVGATSEAFHEIGAEFNERNEEIIREGSEAGREISGEFREAGREIVEDVLHGDFEGAKNEVIEGGAEILRETGEGGFEILREGSEGTIEIVGEGLEGGLDILNELPDIPGIPGI